MSFDVEMMNALIAEGLVATTNFFSGPKAVLPDGAGPYTLFISTGGAGNRLTQDSTSGYAQPSAQITVRASVASVAKAKAQAIHTKLISIRNVELGGIWYSQITADQQVFDVDVDAQNRPGSRFNITAIKRPS